MPNQISLPNGGIEWRISRTLYLPEEDSFYESLFSLSNGRIGIRATANFCNNLAQPGCFINKLYGKAISVPRHIINALNPTHITVETNGLPLELTPQNLSHFNQSLDLKYGYTELAYTHQGLENHITNITINRILLASKKDILITIIDVNPVNYNGFITIKSGISYGHGNSDFPGKRDYVKLHHLAVERFIDIDNIFGVATRNQTDQQLISVYTRVYSISGSFMCSNNHGTYIKNLRFTCHTGVPLKILLVSTFATEKRENDINYIEFLRKLNVNDISSLLDEHFSEWKKRWDTAPEIHADSQFEQGMRYAQFQLAQLVNPNQHSGNVPARALTSEYHFGHFFFNTEYYLVPYFSYTYPQFAKSLLRYRISTLQQAIYFAEKTGYCGARFPEEVDDLGMAAAPKEIIDLFTNDKIIEWSGTEVVHTSADVLYALYRYCEISGDLVFLITECLPLVYYCAEYLVSLMKIDDEIGARSARSVMGFDEFHYHVNHHFATNWLAYWGLLWAADIFEKLEIENKPTQLETLKSQGIKIAKYKVWKNVAKEIYLPPSEEGIYPVFHGYFALPDQIKMESPSVTFGVLNEIDEKRADRMENFSTRLTKQADVVFLMALFPEHFSDEQVKTCLEFYEPRTVHASSLSMTGHALAAARSGDMSLCHKLLYTSLRYNLDFMPRNNYKNGVHVAAYAGAWIVLLEGLIGFRARDRYIELNPRLPKLYTHLSLRFIWRGCQVSLKITKNNIKVQYIDGPRDELHVHFLDKASHIIRKGEISTINISSPVMVEQVR